MWLLDKKLELSVGALTILAFVGLGFSIANEKAKWDEFSSANNCTKIGESQGSTSFSSGYSSSGGAVLIQTSSSDQVGFKCDDGVTYWRSK